MTWCKCTSVCFGDLSLFSSVQFRNEQWQTTDGLLIWSHLYQNLQYIIPIFVLAELWKYGGDGGKQREYFGGHHRAMTALSKQPILRGLLNSHNLGFKQLNNNMKCLKSSGIQIFLGYRYTGTRKFAAFGSVFPSALQAQTSPSFTNSPKNA